MAVGARQSEVWCTRTEGKSFGRWLQLPRAARVTDEALELAHAVAERLVAKEREAVLTKEQIEQGALERDYADADG